MPQGFFTKLHKPTIDKSARPSVKALNCFTCGLYSGCISPKMKPTGEGKKRILVLAESPGRIEDEQGTQLIGESGQLLRQVLKSLNIDLDIDCHKTNSCSCRPENNREPKQIEINSCRQRVLSEIKTFKPHIIIPLGSIAVESLIGDRWHKDLEGISRWRGWQIPDRDLNAWICPTFHPSFVLRSEGNPTIAHYFKKDLEAAIGLIDKPIPVFEDEKAKVTIVETEKEALKWLDYIEKNVTELAIDYETSGIKPQKTGHFIASFALAWSTPTRACIALKTTPTMQKTIGLKVLANRRIGKIAHGFKFEELWSRVILGTRVANWVWCTQTAAHVIDSRNGASWLKFLVYTHFGLVDYDSHIESYLESVEDNGNGFNRINELPIKTLLLYNGLDALFTLQLAEIQREQLKNNTDGYDLLHKGSMAFVDLEENGICVDVPYCEEQQKLINIREKLLLKELDEDDIVKHWRTTYREKFNLFSPVQLKHVLFDHLKIKPLAYTKPTKSNPNGNPSISADTLEDYIEAAPFVKKLVDLRKLTKVRDTFLKGIVEETVDGVIHPFFKLNTVDTFRSSSNSPNLQNIPQRDPEMKKIVRCALIPRPGHQLVEVDFNSAEVRVSASYNNDPVLIDYIKDPTKDMHRDMAMELFMLPAFNVSKEIRHLSKNGFVFPEFYGSYYAEVAPAIWKTIRRSNLTLANSDIKLIDHMKSQGILGERGFANHVQKVEDAFWNKRFRVYNNWKQRVVDEYYTKGYMDTYTGFRIHGPLRKNQITNYAIQGSSSHCLLWSLTRLCQIARHEKWDSRFISQVHDSAICDVDPSEKDHVLSTIKRVMTVDLAKHWSWIQVPMEIEAEITPIMVQS